MDKSKLKPRLIRLGVGLAAGAFLGFSYYSYIGCSTGGCPITSNPYISTGYGALFGAIIAWK